MIANIEEVICVSELKLASQKVNIRVKLLDRGLSYANNIAKGVLCKDLPEPRFNSTHMQDIANRASLVSFF